MSNLQIIIKFKKQGIINNYYNKLFYKINGNQRVIAVNRKRLETVYIGKKILLSPVKKLKNEENILVYN